MTDSGMTRRAERGSPSGPTSRAIKVARVVFVSLVGYGGYLLGE